MKPPTASRSTLSATTAAVVVTLYLVSFQSLVAPSAVHAQTVAGQGGANGEDGASGNPAGDGEDGEDGESISLAVEDVYSALVLNVTGGNGGQGGDGGDGHSTSVLVAAGHATAISTAEGGRGASCGPFCFQPGGDGISEATATSLTRSATAHAIAEGAPGLQDDGSGLFGDQDWGTAQATSRAFASGHNAAIASTNARGLVADGYSQASVSDGLIQSLTATTSATLTTELTGPARLQTRSGAVIGGSLERVDEKSLQSLAVARPVSADLILLSGSFADVDLGGNPLLLGAIEMAGVDGVDDDGMVVSSVVELSTLTTSSNAQNFTLSFLDAEATGAGFDALHFRLFGEDVSLIDMTFTSVADALLFFDNNTMDFSAALSGTDGIFDLRLEFAAVISSAADSVRFDYLVSAVVPLPPALALFAFALAFLGGLRRKHDG